MWKEWASLNEQEIESGRSVTEEEREDPTHAPPDGPDGR
jgi:hypothetical protein